MGKISLREAVKLFNVSRPTLTKAINSGKITGVRNGKGQWEIDPSELTRVYQPRVSSPERIEQVEGGNLPTMNTSEHEVERLKSALALAELRADAAEKLAQERAERIEDFRRMLPPPNDPDATLIRWHWPWQKRKDLR
jgi:hypothetical protein